MLLGTYTLKILPHENLRDVSADKTLGVLPEDLSNSVPSTHKAANNYL